MEIQYIAWLSGIIIGSIMMGAVVFNYIYRREIGFAGVLLLVFGVTLVGLSVLKTVKISFGGLTAHYKTVLAKELKTYSTQVLDKEIENLRKRDAVWEAREPNTDYVSEQSGFVVVMLNAGPTSEENRYVAATGFLEGQQIVGGAAQDNKTIGTYSITFNSFVMPVPKGKRWSIKVNKNDTSSVKIKWFAF